MTLQRMILFCQHSNKSFQRQKLCIVFRAKLGKSSESVQCAMLKACDTCADMGQYHTVLIQKTFPKLCMHSN